MSEIERTYQQLAMKLAREAGFDPSAVTAIFIEPGVTEVSFFLLDENGNKQIVGDEVLTDTKVVFWKDVEGNDV